MSIFKKMSFSLITKFYFFYLILLIMSWGILSLLGFEFFNIIFFITAFVWHFTLTLPGLRDKVLTRYHRLSFLSVVVRLNHYLQIFINLKSNKYASSIIRSISPLLFNLLIYLIGGYESIFFTLLGSFVFEFSFLFLYKKIIDREILTPLVDTKTEEIPPMIPTEESSHE